MKRCLSVLSICCLLLGTAAAEEFQHGEFDLPELALFEHRDLFIRPSLTVSEEYTDNLFRTTTYRNWDLITRLTPGLHFGFPWTRQNAPFLDVSNRIPGGFRYFNLGRPERRVFEGHVSYRKRYDYYRNFPDEDRTRETLEGVLVAENRGHGGIRLLGSRVKGFDPFGTGATRVQDEYEGVAAAVHAEYRSPERFSLRAHGVAYSLEYDDPARDSRNRDDQVWGAGVMYRISGKVRATLDYRHNDIDYTVATANNSSQDLVTAGLDWRMTSKAWGGVRAGNETRESSGLEQDLFVYDALLSYQLTPKLRLHLKSSRGSEETDIAGTRSLKVQDHSLKGFYQMSKRVALQVVTRYRERDYAGLFASGGVVDVRHDRLYDVSTGIHWSLRQWLEMRLSYFFEMRDSNFEDYDYWANRWFAEIRAAL